MNTLLSFFKKATAKDAINNASEAKELGVLWAPASKAWALNQADAEAIAALVREFQKNAVDCKGDEIY